MLKPSDEFYRLIKLFEGCKLTAYLCPAKVVTIGWGSTLDSKLNPFKLGDKITQADADLLLKNEVERKAIFLNKELGKKILNQNQFDSVLLFQYNLGNAGLLRSGLFMRVKKNPNDPLIKNEFAKYNKIKKWEGLPGKSEFKLIESKGLTIRRAAEAKLYFTKL